MSFTSLTRSLILRHPGWSNRSSWLCACAVAMSALFALPGRAVSQQQFEELPVADKFVLVEVDEDAENRRELAQRNRDARAARRDGVKKIQALLLAGDNADTPETQEFFNGWVWPSMTQPENLAQAGKLRYDFDRAYLGTKYVSISRVPFIENVVIPGLQKLISNDRISPAARVNAVVMMSRLDDAPLIRATKTAPRPSLTAFNSLVAIWRGEYPDYLKAAALSGLLRHIEIDGAVQTTRIQTEKKTQLLRSVITDLDAIVAADPTLEDDLNRWKVGKFVELMSKAQLAAQTKNHVDRMIAMIGEGSRLPRWVKLDVVRGLTRMPLDTVARAKIDSLIESVTTFASTSLYEEAELLESRVEELVYDNILWDNIDLEVTGTNYVDSPRGAAGPSGAMSMPSEAEMMGGMMGGMMPGGMGNNPMQEPPEPIVELPNYELNLSRRRMKLIAYSVMELLALKPVQDSATDTHKSRLGALDERFKKFMDEDSNIGVVDLSKLRDDEDEEVQLESYAMQLKNACEAMADDLADQVAGMRGEGAAPNADAAGAAPAAGGDNATPPFDANGAN